MTFQQTLEAFAVISLLSQLLYLGLVLLLTNYDTALTLAYEPFSSATPIPSAI